MTNDSSKLVFTAVVVLLLVCLALNPARAANEKGDVEELVASMTLKEKIGQLIMAKVLESPSGAPADRTKQLIQNLKVGSLIFYSFPNPEKTTIYTNELQKWAKKSSTGIPVLVGSDLEYGPRANVGGDATLLPHQMGLAATDHPEHAEIAATITAEEGRAMGIHWNFAPSADLNTNPENPVIGVRSFGSSPGEVSKFVESAVRGYQEHGMIATLKHYPGHGNTSTDSHYGLPKVSYSEKKLQRHLEPFQSGIDAGADAVMTAHILVDAVDSSYPATTSKKVISGLLRQEQGFEGVIVTDAMNMGAIEDSFGKVHAAVKAIQAGVDVVMSAGNYWDTLEIRDGLLEAVKEGEISKASVDRSVKRVLELKKDYGLLQDEVVNDPARAVKVAGRAENSKSALNIAREAATVVRDEKNLVPINNKNNNILLVGVKGSTNLLKEKFKSTLPKSTLTTYITPSASRYNSWAPSSAGIEEAVKLATDADIVVVLTFSAGKLPDAQVELARKLANRKEKTIVVAEGLPYDVRKLPFVSTFIATYAYNRWNSPQAGNGLMATVVAELLAGKIKPEGELPVRLEVGKANESG
jgi:beta-N-acetylhexosaminidase